MTAIAVFKVAYVATDLFIHALVPPLLSLWLSLLPIAIICHPPSSHLLLCPVAAAALVAPTLGSGWEAESHVSAPLVWRNQSRFDHVPDQSEGAMA